MKKLNISLLFFTLSIFISTACFGQSHHKFHWPNNITINGDSLLANIGINADSIVAEGKILSDSLLSGLSGLNLPEYSNRHSKHYLKKDGEHYYMKIVPPAIKGKEIDHSDVWLLGAK